MPIAYRNVLNCATLLRLWAGISCWIIHEIPKRTSGYFSGSKRKPVKQLQQPQGMRDNEQGFFHQFWLYGSGVSETLNNDLLTNPSCHGFKEENNYHMFIYGMLLAASNDYTVSSNRESGKGRYDCMIKQVDKEKHAVLIEFKHQTEERCELQKEAQNALEQIREKAYIHNLEQEGYKNIHIYGIAFHKKNCEVAM